MPKKLWIKNILIGFGIGVVAMFACFLISILIAVSTFAVRGDRGWGNLSDIADFFWVIGLPLPVIGAILGFIVFKLKKISN